MVLQIIGAVLVQWGNQMQLDMFPRVMSAADNQAVFGIDMSIEGLRSQHYSYFIFGFLVVSLIIFCVIIGLYMPKKGAALKRGEKVMFGAIIMGVVIALIFGWLQLIEGFLV